MSADLICSASRIFSNRLFRPLQIGTSLHFYSIRIASTHPGQARSPSLVESIQLSPAIQVSPSRFQSAPLICPARFFSADPVESPGLVNSNQNFSSLSCLSIQTISCLVGISIPAYPVQPSVPRRFQSAPQALSHQLFHPCQVSSTLLSKSHLLVSVQRLCSIRFNSIRLGKSLLFLSADLSASFRLSNSILTFSSRRFRSHHVVSTVRFESCPVKSACHVVSRSSREREEGGV